MALVRISDLDDLPVDVLDTDLLEIARLAGSGSIDNFKLTVGDFLAWIAAQVGYSPESSASHTADTTTTPGVVTYSHPDGSLANATLASMAQATVKGRAAAAGTGVPVDLTSSQLTAILATLGTNAGVIQIDRQEFTADGTWTKPAGALLALGRVVGGGAGGGSGRCGAPSSDRTGGAGGGAGGVTDFLLRAADLGSTESVDIGAGGAGGTAVGPSATNGNNGNPGSNTTFGSHAVAAGGSLLGAFGGAGGTTAVGTVCPGGSGSRHPDVAVTGTSGTPTAPRGALNALGAGPSAAVSGAMWGTPGGGGGGAGFPAANNTETSGGTGGAAGLGGTSTLAGGTGGGARANGNQGTAPTLDHHHGTGGGGGGSSNSTTVNAGTGAAGRARGGGGGGGGAGTSGGTALSGAGGNGGDGYCLVYTVCVRTS